MRSESRKKGGKKAGLADLAEAVGSANVADGANVANPGRQRTAEDEVRSVLKKNQPNKRLQRKGRELDLA